jgi:hypothetical protein
MPKPIYGALGLVIGGLMVVAFFGATWLQASPSFFAALLLVGKALAQRHVAITKGQNDN